jgi:hypothetical protein
MYYCYYPVHGLVFWFCRLFVAVGDSGLDDMMGSGYGDAFCLLWFWSGNRMSC